MDESFEFMGLKVVLVEDMPDDELHFEFPEGQEHKNIRLVNIGNSE